MKIDTTQPQIGRIYDFVLGGHHNYEVDRKAAEAVVKMVPGYPKWARLNRWFLQLVGSQWAEQGHTRVLDLASGLPTQGHFHEHLPDAHILFSDVDPVSVTYGQQILEGKPNVKYIQADLKTPGTLLAEAATYFGGERKLAVGAIGILYFLSDQEIRTLMAQLHAFCAPGSVMGLSFLHVPDGPDAAPILAAMAKSWETARIHLTPRTPEQMVDLIKPWRMTVHRNAEDWLEVPDMLTGSETALHVVGALAEH